MPSLSLITRKIKMIIASFLYHKVALKHQGELTVCSAPRVQQDSGYGRYGCPCPSELLETEQGLPAVPQMLTGKSWNEDGKVGDLAKKSSA